MKKLFIALLLMSFPFSATAAPLTGNDFINGNPRLSGESAKTYNAEVEKVKSSYLGEIFGDHYTLEFILQDSEVIRSYSQWQIHKDAVALGDTRFDEIIALANLIKPTENALYFRFSASNLDWPSLKLYIDLDSIFLVFESNDEEYFVKLQNVDDAYCEEIITSEVCILKAEFSEADLKSYKQAEYIGFLATDVNSLQVEFEIISTWGDAIIKDLHETVKGLEDYMIENYEYEPDKEIEELSGDPLRVQKGEVEELYYRYRNVFDTTMLPAGDSEIEQ